MTEELEQLLHNLRLYTVAERFDAHLAQAEADGLPVAKLFAALLRDEWHARQEQALKRRLQRARLPEIWTIESFPFNNRIIKDQQVFFYMSVEVKKCVWKSFFEQSVIKICKVDKLENFREKYKSP